MIASQKIGKSFMGALNYNLKKLDHPHPNMRAELLETNFNSIDVNQVKREVDWIRQLRPNLNKYVYHTSLNFSKEEQASLSNENFIAIAKDYLTDNGFNDNQYFIFRHYDADHPHIHLVVNRIRFDGSVVSDSNNYKKSEAVVRAIEIKYKLNRVTSSKQSVQRAVTKDELEKALRTNTPSDKMVLQELMNELLKQQSKTIYEFISEAENKGVHLLFNQASTGRISGITYFYKDFKIKGQALGNKYKWAELIKTFNYEQIRDRETISEANGRTRAIYGPYEPFTGQRQAGDQRRYENGDTEYVPGNSTDAANNGSDQTTANEAGSEDGTSRKRSLETGQNAHNHADNTANFSDDRFGGIYIEITDDEDDAKKHRRRKEGVSR